MYDRNLILILVIFITVTSATEIGSAEQHYEVHQNFRKLGSLATGLSYGHVHSTIKFNQLKHAVKSVLQLLKDRLEKDSTSTVEKDYIKTIQPQIQIAKDALDDLQDLFFGENNQRNKRQVFLGLAIALGIFNTGMSIYNTAEIGKLHSEISGMRSEVVDGFQHVYHILQEENQAITQLVRNTNILKADVRFILDQLYNEQQEIRSIQNMLTVGAITSNLNAELAAWGRGLESLAHGRLHPTLVNKEAMEKAFRDIQEQARKLGMKTLYQDYRSIYKNQISYFATTNEEIVVIVHIPLVEMEPLELFEYLPIPVKIDNIFLTMEGKENLLATDLKGQNGLEMSTIDLIRCQTEDVHHGKMFICPNGNLLQNRIRSSCLGSIFFGHQAEAMKRCFHYAQLPEDHEEFIQQISDNAISLFTHEDLTARQTCAGVTQTRQNVTGLATLVVPAGCKLTTEKYTFMSPAVIDLTNDFIKKTMKIATIKMFNDTSSHQIEEKLRSLNKMKNPEKVHLETLKNWIQEEKSRATAQNFNYASNALALIGCGIVILIIALLYFRYKKKKAASK